MGLMLPDSLEGKILLLEQRIKRLSAAIGHCIANTAFWLIVAVVVFLTHPTTRPTSAVGYFLDLLGPIILIPLALVIWWQWGQAQGDLQRLRK